MSARMSARAKATTHPSSLKEVPIPPKDRRGGIDPVDFAKGLQAITHAVQSAMVGNRATFAQKAEPGPSFLRHGDTLHIGGTTRVEPVPHTPSMLSDISDRVGDHGMELSMLVSRLVQLVTRLTGENPPVYDALEGAKNLAAPASTVEQLSSRVARIGVEHEALRRLIAALEAL